VYVDKGVTPEDDHLMAETFWDTLVVLFHRHTVIFFADGFLILVIVIFSHYQIFFKMST
jgi:hypothetical protein